jgi:peptidoglycan/xylan/chitin deacetylase (PgdA/CDA1 family)
MSVGRLLRVASKLAVLPAGLLRRRRRGDVVILVYHRVGVGDREIDMPKTVFQRQLNALRERERVLELDDALAGLDGGVVLTFDDGYRDFSDVVVPLLVERKLPALLYLATSLATEGASRNGSELISWDRLREAVATGLVTVGSHTHTHADLSKATESEAVEEMRRSKNLIEDHLGTACEHFAYPWGVASPGAQRAATSIFRTAALPAWKTNRRGRIDPMRLGRTPVLRGDGLVFFRSKARGMLDGEGLVYRALGRGPWRRG